MEHFGVELVKRKYSFIIKREEFALINTKPSLPKFDSLVKRKAYKDDNAKEYSLKWCEEYRNICLENYDLNMKFFRSLDKQEFDSALSIFLKANKKFHEIDNLVDYKGIEGYYLMVLDKYKQVYIGKSNDISKRIRQHWTRTRSFDRTLLPMYAVTTSCFSIDFFRALDTTRIFIWENRLSENIERKLVAAFPQKFNTNRIGGDITNGLEALLTLNTRDL